MSLASDLIKLALVTTPGPQNKRISLAVFNNFMAVKFYEKTKTKCIQSLIVYLLCGIELHCFHKVAKAQQQADGTSVSVTNWTMDKKNQR